MQFVESVVYFGILCIHYPLRITLATSKTAKDLVEKGINVHKQVSSNVNTTVAKQYQTLNDYLLAIKEYILNVPTTVRLVVYNFIPFGLTNGNSQHEPKNQYEKTFLRFQLAAFEKERVEYQKEIRRLQDELQRTQNKSNNFDKERQKYENQIKTLEENLGVTNARFNSERERLAAEYDEEKQFMRKEIMKLQNQLNKSQLDFEQLNKMQISGFDKERQQYQQELRKLYAKISQLENELEDSHKDNDVNDGNQSENEEDDNLMNPYVNDAIKKIDKIKRDVIDIKSSVSTFIGKEKCENAEKLKEKLLNDLAELENIKIKGHGVIKKRRQETIKLLKKHLDELKDPK